MHHRDGCEAVARWFMGLEWCDFAVVEIAGRSGIGGPQREDYDAFGPWYEARQAWHKTPEAGGGVLDVMALTTPALDNRRRLALRDWERQRAAHEARRAQPKSRLREFSRNKPRPLRPRVAIAEVKVKTPDLKRDLRVGKMLRYQSQASHVYLALLDEVYHAVDLDALGLPKWWGILEISPRGAVFSRRNPRAYDAACEPGLELRRTLLNRAAVSLAHRALR